MTEVKHKSQRSDVKLTPEVRIAFPFVHEKRTKRANGELLKTPRYDLLVLLPKLHVDPAQCPNYRLLSDHCMEAAGKAWPGHGWPAGGKWPIQDGDVPYVSKPKPGVAPRTAEQVAAANAWRKGFWIAEASSNLEPGPRVAIMQNGQVVDIPSKVIAGKVVYKSGDYGFVSLHAYSYQNETFGVNFGFEGVLFTREGEAIGSAGPKTAAQMFGDVAAFGAGAPAGGPPPPPPPAPAPAYAPPAPPTAPAPAPAYAPPPPPPPPPAATAAAPGLPPFPSR